MEYIDPFPDSSRQAYQIVILNYKSDNMSDKEAETLKKLLAKAGMTVK